MKTLQYLVFIWPLLFGQIFSQSHKIIFNLEVGSEEITEIVLTKYQFETGKMKVVESISVSSSIPDYTIEERFTEPCLYGIRLNTGKEIKIAVEEKGELLLRLGPDILLESRVAVKTDFAQTIQQLNGAFFGGLIKDYDKAIKENDLAAIAKLEAKKPALMDDFVKAMEDKVRQMGASAEAYEALAYFDLHKNYHFLIEMSKRFKMQYPGSGMTLSLQKRMEKAALLAMGKTAPEFTTLVLGGTRINLADFRGSYLLIDFWASWCRACRVENPQFLNIYNSYNDKGFKIISVSIDEDSVQWKKAIEKDALTWTQVLDIDHAIYDKYLLSSLPSNFLLDRNGKIIAKNVNGEALEVHLRQLVDN